MSDITEAQLKRAVQEIDLLLKRRQHFWERWRSVAMVVLAVAAVFAAGNLSALLFPPHAQQISVHFDQPLTVKLTP
jgi:hypothetical protein